jgi:hypothetical protein
MKFRFLSPRVITAGIACLALTLACNVLASTEPEATALPTTRPEPTKTRTPVPTVAPTEMPPTKEPAPVQEEDVIFRDNFDGSIDKSWKWTHENQDAWNLSANPGWLEIMAGAGQVSDGNIENLLLRPGQAENFELETSLKFQPAVNFQFAGLLIYESRANFIQFGRAFCDVPAPTCAGDGFYIDLATGGDLNPENYSIPAPETDTVYLRLRREGNTFTAYASEDGIEWQLIGSHVGEIDPDFVGLVSGQNTSVPEPAQFDSFLIRELPATSAETVPSQEPSCYRWDEITLEMAGEVVCVYGIAYSHQGQSRIDFSPEKNSFFLIDAAYYYPNLSEGSCVVAEEKVEVFDKTIPFMTIRGKLFKCKPWMME